MRAFLLAFLALQSCVLSAGPREDKDLQPWARHQMTKEELEADKGLAEIQERIQKGDLPKVQFAFDSAKLDEESFTTLDAIADLLLKNPAVKIRIGAHTCIMGTYEHNMALSQRRAESVMDYLLKRGVPPPSIRYHGYGPTQPIADNSTEEGREKNRRVEFRLLTRRWKNAIY